VEADAGLGGGVLTAAGQLTNAVVADALGRPAVGALEVLATP